MPKLFLFFHGWPRGLLDCLLSLLGGVYYRLTILFQVLLVRLSLQCGRCTYVSNKGGLLVSLISKGGDILFGFSCKDTHHIDRECFGLVFEFSACDSCPLLALNNVRMDPHWLSSRSRNRDKNFLFLVIRISINHS